MQYLLLLLQSLHGTLAEGAYLVSYSLSIHWLTHRFMLPMLSMSAVGGSKLLFHFQPRSFLLYPCNLFFVTLRLSS